jgi:hypothetical protein
MITAMQRMLDDLLAKRVVYENAKMYECVATLETSIEIAQFLLEKEKEQIINAYEDGKQNGIESITNINKYIIGEYYYNQTLNQNK